MSEPTPERVPTRQWSCATLLRGNSFLAEQQQANKFKSYDDVIAVSYWQVQEIVRIHSTSHTCSFYKYILRIFCALKC